MGLNKDRPIPKTSRKPKEQLSRHYQNTLAKWQNSPEWQRQVKQVLVLKEKGFEENDICAVTEIEINAVKRIIEDEENAKTLIKKHWENKIPTIKDIIGMGLYGIQESLKEMQNPKIRKKMITKMGDLSALTKIVTDLNMLLRLEEGKSTQNLAVKNTYSETRTVLQSLAKVDPVFQYALDNEETKSE